jgi:hypothetical protein
VRSERQVDHHTLLAFLVTFVVVQLKDAEPAIGDLPARSNLGEPDPCVCSGYGSPGYHLTSPASESLTIVAPGFDLVTSPTRITRGLCSRYGKRPGNRPIRVSRRASSHPRICGPIRAIGHTNRLCDQSARRTLGRPSAERPGPHQALPSGLTVAMKTSP